ncbi:MAG: hypothetical protein PHP23_03325 [Desulfobacterales bacterium]|nr:hypothetical protein [Desulfobacterales bacterium]MDD4073780.1 hypothetical protein [Desulfobacterales bacterium]MDD4393879.1 hypothetical protein [Desulfobacterales bacterium]
MASEMLSLTVVDFLDSMLRSNPGNLRIHEIKICESSRGGGSTIRDSGFKEKFNLLGMAVKNGDGEIEFNPSRNDAGKWTDADCHGGCGKYRQSQMRCA